MKTYRLATCFVFFAWLLAACAAPAQPTVSPTSQPTQAPQPTRAAQPTLPPAAPPSDAVPPFIPAVRKAAAAAFNASEGEVNIIKLEPVEWPNGCLGAAKPGEICAMVITPGYRVQVEIKGKTYILHCDSSGASVRIPQASPEPASENLPAVAAARAWLSDYLKVDASAITLLSLTEENWPDGCLGIHKQGIMCTMAIVPGYRVLLQALGATYEIRTNQSGKTVALYDPGGAASPSKGPVNATPSAAPLLSWKSGGTPCLAVQVASTKAAYGPCGASPQVVPFADAERGQQLAYFEKTYAPFSAQTAAGEVVFNGSGLLQASAAQQRALAEWAQLVYVEVSTTAPMTNLGLAYAWHREGGIAGFCDDLRIYRSGLAVGFNCKGGSQKSAGSAWLNDTQLTLLFGWLDQLRTSDFKSSDPAKADGMSISGLLSGSGSRAPSETERLALLNFGSQVLVTLK